MLQSPLFNQLLNIQQSAAAQNAEELQYANENFAPLSESKLPQWLNGPVSEVPSPIEDDLIAPDYAAAVVRKSMYSLNIAIGLSGCIRPALGNCHAFNYYCFSLSQPQHVTRADL